jgi:subfamily B ATP-binding cassette protein MsbA
VQGFKYLLHRFLPYFRDYKVEFALAILGMVMAAVGTTATAYIIKPVLDKIFIEQNQELLTLLPFGVVLVYLVKGGGAFLQVYYAAYIGQDIVRRIRDKLLGKILSFEMDFFHKYRSGELISRSINDIERIRQVVSNVIPMMIREILTIIALLGYIFYLNPKMAILAILFLPLTAAPLSNLAKKMKRLSHSSQEKLSDLTARLSEIFNNIEIIKANATENYEHQRFLKENKKIFDVNIKATKTTELVSPMMEVVGSLAVALVIMYGGQEVIDKEMSVGSFFSFLAALFMLYTPIKRVSNMYNKMQDAIAASERIFALLERENRIIGTTNDLNEEISKVTFKDVDLYYEGKKALSNVSFEIAKGESIALVGNSGGGKSSIVNLLLRFYDVHNGEIAFNGTNINHFSLNSIRKNISIVTQRIYIFNDTVASNVAYGEEIDEEKVIHALKQANAWDFIQELEKGIYTEINEFGTNLSGGQRQRIAIARAIYRDPKILIFDEATSALDTKSEQEITKALEKISKDKITIIIAHRLKTIEHADKIIVLKEGKISCIGSKSELLKHCDEFKQLNGLQR